MSICISVQTIRGGKDKIHATSMKQFCDLVAPLVLKYKESQIIQLYIRNSKLLCSSQQLFNQWMRYD